jgi:hypothetical protein
LGGGFADFKRLLPGVRQRRRSNAIAHGVPPQPKIERVESATKWKHVAAATSAGGGLPVWRMWSL